MAIISGVDWLLFTTAAKPFNANCKLILNENGTEPFEDAELAGEGIDHVQDESFSADS